MRPSRQAMLDYVSKCEEEFGREVNCIYDTILTFSLDESQVKVVRTAALSVSKMIKIFETEFMPDLYAIPSFCTILNPSIIPEDDLKGLYSFWKEENFQEIVFLYPPYVPVPGSVRQRIKVIPDLLEDRQNLKLIILNQISHLEKKEKEFRKYDRRIYRLLSIVKMLKKQKYVTIKEIAEEFNICRRTAQRDITLLTEVGELIWYEHEQKAYSLIDGESMVWPV